MSARKKQTFRLAAQSQSQKSAQVCVPPVQSKVQGVPGTAGLYIASSHIWAKSCPLYVRTIYCTRDMLLRIDLTAKGMYLDLSGKLKTKEFFTRHIFITDIWDFFTKVRYNFSSFLTFQQGGYAPDYTTTSKFYLFTLPTPQMETFLCQLCGTNFKTNLQLGIHQRVKHEEKNLHSHCLLPQNGTSVQNIIPGNK